MSRYTITITVNEEDLRYVSNNTIDPIEELVYQELDLYDLEILGIIVEEVKKIEDE